MQRTNLITLLTAILSIALWLFLYFTNPIVAIIIGSVVVAFAVIALLILIFK